MAERIWNSLLTKMIIMDRTSFYRTRHDSCAAHARQRFYLSATAITGIVVSVLTLSACAGAGSSSGSKTGADSGPAQPGQNDPHRSAAQAKLERMLAAKRLKQSKEQEEQRAAEQKAAAAAAEAAKPHYDPTRLNIAKNWRQWADITIPDLNIKCWLKSNWKDGKMHLRLALLGDKTALRLFTGNWTYLRLVFANQQGVNLHQCFLATNDLKWADGLRNSGVPTMEFEADDECSLEIYESIVQWNLQWTNELD